MKNGCSYCGVLKALDGGPLSRCPHCGMAAYCGDEHQKYDWKRHKMRCKAVQSRLTAKDASSDAVGSSVGRLSGSTSTGGPSTSSATVITICTTSTEPTIPVAVASVSHATLSTTLSDSSAPFEATERVTELPNESRSLQNFALVHQKNCRKRVQPTDEVSQIKDHSKNFLFTTTLQDHLRILTASGLALSHHQAVVLRLKTIAEHVIRSLNEYGWSIVDNFLGSVHCSRILSEFEELYSRGLFSAGLLMDEKHGWTSPVIRSDQVYWFGGSKERSQDAVTTRWLISMINAVIMHFNGRIPYNIGRCSKAMISVYPGNATRYVKHVDNPRKDGRCVTVTYFCNKAWKQNEYGGALRLFPHTSLVPVDVDPKADRLVFLWSDWRVPHEVLPCFRKRYSLTIWYFDQSEDSDLSRRMRQENDEQCLSCCSVISSTSRNDQYPSSLPSGISKLADDAISSQRIKSEFGCDESGEDSGFVELQLSESLKSHRSCVGVLNAVTNGPPFMDHRY
ncbi:hypothetical protein AB6A40_002576 [Gnathostoma spinigerum]|uniref:hypoxia-inducible factor-proline dioxygenase n=1 Tax=Gnathostoma spinigerum TaxID=75299 RepID=A0ABD6E973_9BILA